MGFFSCWLHWIIIGIGVLYTLLQIVFYSVFSARKKEVSSEVKNRFVRWLKSLSNANFAFLCNIGINVILWFVFIFISHCWFCTLLLILYFIWIVITIGILFYRQKIVEFLLKKLKKGKKTKRKTKWITRLTKWKNEIEFDNAAITLNDAFNAAPCLDSSSNFKFEKINKIIKKFGECEIKQGENSGGRIMIQDHWTYYATVKDKDNKDVKKVFAQGFDVKKKGGKAAVLLLRVEPKERKEIFRFYSSAAVSKYPMGREFIAFPITNFVSVDSCEIFLRKAYDYAVKELEEKEFDKMSKKIKM